MTSYSEYYRNLLKNHDEAVKRIYNFIPSISGKKRKYADAMGKENDYEIVQDTLNYKENIGSNWIDAYLENKK